MEWISTDIMASPGGPVTATVAWRDPDPSFMQALAMSALNRMTMPIKEGGGLTGYVRVYRWEHRQEDFVFGGPKMIVFLTVEYVVVP